jgi:hypothetical protein
MSGVHAILNTVPTPFQHHYQGLTTVHSAIYQARHFAIGNSPYTTAEYGVILCQHLHYSAFNLAYAHHRTVGWRLYCSAKGIATIRLHQPTGLAEAPVIKEIIETLPGGHCTLSATLLYRFATLFIHEAGPDSLHLLQ